MDFKAEPKTIQEILTKKKKFIIPRFQREFTWEREHVETLWDDLLDNIIVKDNTIKSTEYFLGSLVLIDDDDSKQNERIVIDGQQRLTVLTIFLSSLYDSFIKINEAKLANIVYSYIVTQDNNGNDITLLETESPKPYFQLRIQQKEKDLTQTPESNEEKKLYNAYDFLLCKLEEKNLIQEVKRRYGLDIQYVEILKTIRDQLLNCKLVYVSVRSISDAYMIFEVLNAKGEPLSVVDLVKNSIFSKLTDITPIDAPLVSWNKIKTNIEKNEDIETFYRHFWLSNYNFITQKKLFQDFEQKIPKSKKTYKSFLASLEKTSELYKKFLIPNKNDWNTPEKISIYYFLNAFNIFGITQVRTILIALFDSYNSKKINLKQLKYNLELLENFHFVFTAVCSMRPSGLESRYSKYSLKLHNEKDKNIISSVLKDFEKDMRNSLPSYKEFENNFKKLKYTDEEQKDKKKIQYIFSKIERYLMSTQELDILSLSIEHIDPQSNENDFSGAIGNLLILGADLNSDIGNLPFEKKLEKYKTSNFKSTLQFYEENRNKTIWTKEDIDKRTIDIADLLYKEICRFN